MRRINFFLLAVLIAFPFYQAQTMQKQNVNKWIPAKSSNTTPSKNPSPWKNNKAVPTAQRKITLPIPATLNKLNPAVAQKVIYPKQNFPSVSPFYNTIINGANACNFDVITAGFIPAELLNEWDRSFILSPNNVSPKDITVVSCKKSVDEIKEELKWTLRKLNRPLSMTFCELPQEQNYPGNLDIQNSLCQQNSTTAVSAMGQVNGSVGKGIASSGSIPIQQAASSNLHLYTTAGCSGMPGSGISQSVGHAGILGMSAAGSTCQNNDSGSSSSNSNSSENNDVLHSMLCGQGDSQKQGVNQFVDSRKADGEGSVDPNKALANARANGETIIISSQQPKGSPGEGKGRVTVQLSDGKWASVIYGGSQSGEKPSAQASNTPPPEPGAIADEILGAVGGENTQKTDCSGSGCMAQDDKGNKVSIQPNADGSGYTATIEDPSGVRVEMKLDNKGNAVADPPPPLDGGDNKKSPKPDDSGPPDPFILYLTASLQKEAGPNTGQSQNIDHGPGDLNNPRGNNNDFKPPLGNPNNPDAGPGDRDSGGGIEITACKRSQNHIDCTRAMSGDEGACSGNSKNGLLPKPPRPQTGGGDPKARF